MSRLHETPSGERVHISLFGRRNAGKSSLINAITGQSLAIVSEQKGTTTDPVSKAMELLPLGPVLVTDTPGLDDEGELGALRVEKARQVLGKTDIALLVVDACAGLSPEDRELLALLRERKLPRLLVMNQCDRLPENTPRPALEGETTLWVSAATGENIHQLKEAIAALRPASGLEKRIVADLLSPGDLVVLVTPIDEAAPKGRLILPQQQTIRDILEAGAMAAVTRETELPQTLAALKAPPKMVITDSQAFAKVSKDVPETVPLTSFSILFARYKGNLMGALRGVKALETLEDGDKVLISEGCTHHRQCNDIGTVKIPGWIRKKTGKEPEFVFTSGGEFPQDLTPYRLIVHCGGCMLNEREMQTRARRAAEQGVPMTNYGILIAHITGILARSVELFPEAAALLG